MRTLRRLVFAGMLASFAGCNEFVATSESVTSLDVVGDPSDPIPDSMEPADILGSALPASDDSESLTDLRPQAAPPASQAGVPDEQQPPSGNGVAKPVSLKTSVNGSSK